MLIEIFFKERINMFSIIKWNVVMFEPQHIATCMFALRWAHKALWTLLSTGTHVGFLPKKQVSKYTASPYYIGPARPSHLYTEHFLNKATTSALLTCILSCLYSYEWHHFNHVQSKVHGGIVQTPRALLQEGPEDCVRPPGSRLHHETEPGQHG